MVFENLALLTVNVDGTPLDSLFGDAPDAAADEASDAADAVTDETASKPGMGRKAGYAAVVGLAVLGSLVARRLRRPATVEA